ncbi:MAG TPA: hypothetical protein DCM87_14655 [Planctomycetes bacterium]|nr:hypothetical protein [Planctomycetota bacterium]
MLAAALAAGENRLWVQDGEALPGTSRVTLALYATHDDPLNAFSAALNYDIAALEFLRASLDGPGIITGASNYEYSMVQHDGEAGDIVIAVLLDFEQPYDKQTIPASPVDPQTLAKLDFGVKAGVEPGTYGVRPRSTLSYPMIINCFTVGGGFTVLPAVDTGVFTVLNPYHLYVVDAKASVGGYAVVAIEAEHMDPIGGYTLSLRYPSDVLSIDVEPLDDPNIPPPENPWGPDDYSDENICNWPITWCNLGLESLLSPGGIDTFRAWAQADYTFGPAVPGVGRGWVWSDAIFDFPPFAVLPLGKTLPAGRHKILQVKFKLADSVAVGQEIPLTLVNVMSTVDIYNMLIVPFADGYTRSVRPDLHAGTITVVDEVTFRRGYVNPDSDLNVADVIFMLQYLFAKGTTPGCLKAADVNDDGAVDIADAIWLLAYLFRHAAPPRPPFTACGPDPTSDLITCTAPSGC